jgi:hypothetical protein
VGTTDHVYRLDLDSSGITWKSPKLAATPAAITVRRQDMWVAFQTS